MQETPSATSDAKEAVARLIRESPKVHDWGHGLVSGGLEGDIVATMAAYLIDEFGIGKFRSLETGAGLSTMIFVAARPASHIVINPDDELRARILGEINARNLDLQTMNYILDVSERVLPDLAKQYEIDIALIDGGHGWPTVFVDFCYINMMLRQGGIMIVDDIMAFPCMQLFLLLKHQPGWKLEKVIYSKTAFFRKENDRKFMPDFGGQPYLVNNMLFM